MTHADIPDPASVPVPGTPDPAPDDVWSLARDAYLEGASGHFVCRSFGLAPSTFWRRAGLEGWLRRDRPTPAAPPLDPSAPLEPSANQRDLAWQRLGQALAHGRATEAQRWLTLHQSLSAIAQQEARAAEAARDPGAESRRLRAHMDRLLAEVAQESRGGVGRSRRPADDDVDLDDDDWEK